MSKALMVGYLESWGQLTFTQAAEKGYDAIVMAFGTIDGSQVNIYDGKFAPSPSKEDLKKDIANAKTKGAKQILFSVGGENNTYNPKNAPIDELASNIISFLKEFGFTGIDFDLEIDGDSQYLDNLCAAIKNKASELLITAAPQVNQGAHTENLFLVSTGTSRMYDIAVKNKRFDYLFIQDYNNQWPKIDNFTQVNVGFIAASFKNLKNSIPIETLITIGEPANKNGAGTSVFNGPDAGPDIYNLMANQYKQISNDPQFGGAMTWDINLDADTDFQFVNTIKPSINPQNLKKAA